MATLIGLVVASLITQCSFASLTAWIPSAKERRENFVGRGNPHYINLQGLQGEKASVKTSDC
eukprot:1160680-Pelagomonas_calceolata.AAC.16